MKINLETVPDYSKIEKTLSQRVVTLKKGEGFPWNLSLNLDAGSHTVIKVSSYILLSGWIRKHQALKVM